MRKWGAGAPGGPGGWGKEGKGVLGAHKGRGQGCMGNWGTMGGGEGGLGVLRGLKKWEYRVSLGMTEMGEGGQGVPVVLKDGKKGGKEVFGAKEGVQEVPVPWHAPVMVPIAEGTHRNGKGCPDGVQCVPHHFCLVADGETGGKNKGVTLPSQHPPRL